MKTIRRSIATACFLVIAATAVTSAAADTLPFLHPLFTDHMVLQRDIKAPVWGWSKPGQTVTVSIAGQQASATAGDDGRWMATVGPLTAGGPHTLQVTGTETVSVNDVLVGDVWICSGQSNMEWPVQAANNARQEIAEANYPQIRLFTVPKRVSPSPQQTVDGQWQRCTPQTVGGFSAVGYFFGRELDQQLDVPIGLVHTSWGGTIAEAWTSAEALMTMDDFRPAVTSLQNVIAAQSSGKLDFNQLMQKWWNENDPGSKQAWNAADVDASDWKSMNVPGLWESQGLSDFDGIVWFQTAVDVSQEDAGKAAVLHLGGIDDRDTTWVNGQMVGAMNDWNAQRNYSIDSGILQAGRNVITIRVLDTGGGGGMHGQPQQLSLEIKGGKTLPLAGQWSYKVSTALKDTTTAPQPLQNNPNVVTVLYNGMLAPLVPYGIRGAIWYQGESNAGRSMQYRTLLPTMIADWRARFGQGEFPFLVVQLANFMAPQQQPVESGWAELREAQWLTARNDQNVGLALAIDIGQADDIHPRNKQEVGRRLALSALEIAYHQDVVSGGPRFVSAEFKDGKAYLKFDRIGAGLVAQGDKLNGFAIAADDKKFVWGDAEIQADTVVVSAATIKSPTAVRYGWANNPDCNLYNQSGLPASPFRTDYGDSD
ncbi:beta galactosidase jelly roll domain-containing protein [Stieleria sp. TO1_6]|uniref:sialate O-acetylesterase n=1 Tax=Stieleria tagensis TaxID=2956795 RepID=UPI00209B1ECA|nr:sialate O-acetylesterase [Stieleria tagensis]MCO8120121.1 beta galactosidase jelly roll domain-containing protein [Stieleria tagensis]